VADLVVAALEREGRTAAEARRSIWFFDSKGLVTTGRDTLEPHKRAYAQDHAPVRDLSETIRALRPDALIGLSTRGGAFDEGVLRTLADVTERPIVFALSNPTANAECTAEQAYAWTDGRAVFASGSPFQPVEWNGRRLVPRQANNAYVFPGVGLGVVVSCARHVTDAMFLAAADALAGSVTEEDRAHGSVLPDLERIREISARVAAEVVRLAQDAGLARAAVRDPAAAVVAAQYQAEYRAYV
jgi:malate dehydrogenase (oxaloacetate-decarboxylating)(NADP+)